jgi:hypothetical protein
MDKRCWANPSSLIQIRGGVLPEGDQSKAYSRNGEYAIEYNIPIPSAWSFPGRTLGWILVMLAYCCGTWAALRVYCGRKWSGALIFIIAGILAHAGLSFLLFEHWLFF